MWSLRRATDDLYDAFLVVSFISETRILEMNADDELEETEIDGFCSQVQTLFCHDAVYNQLVQVGYYLIFSHIICKMLFFFFGLTKSILQLNLSVNHLVCLT